MDSYNALCAFVTTIDRNDLLLEEKINQLLHKGYAFLPEEKRVDMNKKREELTDEKNIFWEYLHAILYVLTDFFESYISRETSPIRSDLLAMIDRGIQVAIHFGIKQCVSWRLSRKANVQVQKREHITEVRLFKRLAFTVTVLYMYFANKWTRSSLMQYYHLIFAALLELSYKPVNTGESNQYTNATTEPRQDADFPTESNQTFNLYDLSRRCQKSFRQMFTFFLNNSPSSLRCKEFLTMSTFKDYPKWVRYFTMTCFLKELRHPLGIYNTMRSFGVNLANVESCWKKLDMVVRLLLSPQIFNSEPHLNAICNQIPQMLSTNAYHATLLGNCLIRELYEINPRVCQQKIFDVIFEPFYVKSEDFHCTQIVRDKEAVDRCINKIFNCFISTKSNFKRIPIKHLMPIALPLFNLHMFAYKSKWTHRFRLRHIVLALLDDESTQKDMFSLFLTYRNVKHFGEKLSFRAAHVDGFEIIGGVPNITFVDLRDCLFDLTDSDVNVTLGMFHYLLESLPIIWNKIVTSFDEQIFTTDTDTEGVLMLMEERVISEMILQALAESNIVRKRPLELHLIIRDFITKQSHMILDIAAVRKLRDDDDFNMFYLALELLKIVLKDYVPENPETLIEFATFINELSNYGDFPYYIVEFLREIIDIMRDIIDPPLDFDAPVNTLNSIPNVVEAFFPTPKIVPRVSELFTLYQYQLGDEKADLYVKSITGICSLVDEDTDQAVRILVNELMNIEERKASVYILPGIVGYIGDVLVETARKLGSKFTRYTGEIIRGLLTGARSPYAKVRLASILYINSFCRAVGFQLRDEVNEIFYAIGCIVKMDENRLCRRMTAILAFSMLRGLGKDVLSNMESELAHVYRGLSHMCTIETIESTRGMVKSICDMMRDMMADLNISI